LQNGFLDEKVENYYFKLTKKADQYI